MHQYATLEDTLYFGFAANLTSGAAGDGASPLFDVRLGGDTSGAAPILSGTPTLLTGAGYSDGCYEVAIAATAVNGFAAGNTYLVFVTLTIDSVTPAAMIGSFKLSPVPANTKQWNSTAVPSEHTAGYPIVTIKDGTGTGEINTNAGAVALVDLVTTTTTATNVTTVNGLAANVITAAAIATDAIDGDAIAASAVTEIQSGLATAAALDAVDNFLDTEVAAILSDTNAILADTGTDGVVVASGSKSGYALSSAGVTAIWAEVVEGTTTAVQMMRGFAAALLGKASGLNTTTAIYRDTGDTKNRITASVDVYGNRTAVTRDLT